MICYLVNVEIFGHYFREKKGVYKRREPTGLSVRAVRAVRSCMTPYLKQ
jgi:hypothetical protein